jgi:hypothetical protein
MNEPNPSPARDRENRVETCGGGVFVEFIDTDPRVVHDTAPISREEMMRRRPTALIEEYLEAGYFNEETARVAREELERRKKQPPATS